jgi:hypothetical protein
MLVVLDTSSIYRDFFLERPATVTFLTGLARIPAKLLVPEVVIDEMVSHYRRDLESALEQHSSAGQQIARLRAAEVPSAPSFSVQHSAEKYREVLVARIANFGGEVVPYPKTNHKALVERDLAGRKPFAPNGKGYRDALIWESLLGKTWGGQERIVFVSANSNDFGKSPRLHDELRREVWNPDRVSLAGSLQEVNATWVVPKMEMLEAVRRELEAHSAGQVDLLAWVKSRLLDIIREESEAFTDLVPWSPVNRAIAYPSELVELRELRVHSVRPLLGDEVLVRIGVRVDLDVFVTWNDFGFKLGRGIRKHGVGDASTNILQEFSVGLDLVLDRKKGEVIAEEVAMMGNEYTAVDYGSWGETPTRTNDDAKANG